MTINIELTPEVEADLVAQAARSGLPIDRYIRTVLEQHVSPSVSRTPAMTAVDRARAFEDWVRTFPYRRNEPLPDEAITRDSFYSTDGE